VGAYGMATACDFTPFVKEQKPYPGCMFLPPSPVSRMFKDVREGILQLAVERGAMTEVVTIPKAEYERLLADVAALRKEVEEPSSLLLPLKVVLERLPHLWLRSCGCW